jgi:hypothetical protein
VERVAEEEAESGTGVGAGLDDELARDDPERLGDDEPARSGMKRCQGASLGRAAAATVTSTIELPCSEDFKLRPWACARTID